MQAGKDDVATLECAVLDQHGGNRTATLVKSGLDHHAFTRRFRHGLELEHFGDQQHRFQQLIDAFAGLRRDRNELGVAAPLFGDHAVL